MPDCCSGKMVTYALNKDYVYKIWAYVSNTPLRNYKNNMHDGSISAPFLIWYPKAIKASISEREQPI